MNGAKVQGKKFKEKEKEKESKNTFNQVCQYFFKMRWPLQRKGNPNLFSIELIFLTLVLICSILRVIMHILDK